MFEFLLDNKANPNGATTLLLEENLLDTNTPLCYVSYITPLHEAILWPNKPEILYYLLMYGANIGMESIEQIYHKNNKITLSGAPLNWAIQLDNQAAIQNIALYTYQQQHVVPPMFFPCIIL